MQKLYLPKLRHYIAGMGTIKMVLFIRMYCSLKSLVTVRLVMRYSNTAYVIESATNRDVIEFVARAE